MATNCGSTIQPGIGWFKFDRSKCYEITDGNKVTTVEITDETDFADQIARRPDVFPHVGLGSDPETFSVKTVPGVVIKAYVDSNVVGYFYVVEVAPRIWEGHVAMIPGTKETVELGVKAIKLFIEHFDPVALVTAWQRGNRQAAAYAALLGFEITADSVIQGIPITLATFKGL